MASTESIRELAAPVLASAGLELWDLEITRDAVRIMVERPMGAASSRGVPQGIDLDALSAASAALSPVLDAHPEVTPEGRYQLEVSSPGIERTLRTPEQFRRYLNAEINVKTSIPVEGARRHRGRLLDAGADGIVLEPDDRPDVRVDLRYDQIDRARTVVVWAPSGGRPGAGHPATGRRSRSPAATRQPGAPAAAQHLKDAGS
jgi:ribosome maturation factor RimP